MRIVLLVPFILQTGLTRLAVTTSDRKDQLVRPTPGAQESPAG